MAQLCLEDEAGVQAFAQELENIAASEGLTFRDESARLRADLLALDEAAGKGGGAVPAIADRVIGMDVSGEDGMGISAVNQRFPGHQVVLGFSRGSDEKKSRAFAERVIRRLEDHWSVLIIQSDRGAMSLTGCS